MALQQPMAVPVFSRRSASAAGAGHQRTPSPCFAAVRKRQQRTTTIVAAFKSPTNKQQKPRVRGGTDGIFGTSGGIGFTKENELFVGRVAASLLGEAVTGKGILAQLNLETGIPITEAEPLLLFFILFTLLGAIGALGDRGRFGHRPRARRHPARQGLPRR